MCTHTLKTAGFTLVEVLIASTISVIVVASILPITMDLANQSQISSIRSDLRSRVNLGRNYLFNDIRGSSRSGMVTRPDANDNIVAIAMPKFVRTSASSLPVTVTGTTIDVNWTKQIIYYISTTTGQGGSTCLYRADLPYATFKALTSTQKNTLLDNLVATRATSIATLTSNRPIVKNIKNYSIKLGSNVDIDGYSPIVERATVSIGTALLEEGVHTLKFTVTGKNSASSATGYGIGIDSFVISPAVLPLEGESYITGADVTGSTALATRMMNPSWHNNQILDFPATVNGNSFTLKYYYDTWEESVFSDGDYIQKTDSAIAALADGDVVVQMAGNDTTWRGESQATNAFATDTGSLMGCTVRTIVKGEKIVYNGRQCKVTFMASLSAAGNGPYLGITDAYIMERSGTTGFNGNSATSKQLTFSNAPWTNPGGWIFDKNTGSHPTSGTSILIWGACASGYADLEIDKTKDYIVSYHVDVWSGWGAYWQDNGCQAARAPTDIPLSAIWYNDTTNNVNTATWSSGSYTEVNQMVGVSQIDATYPDTASYVSQIVDTKLDNPAYKDITWTGELPGNTGLSVSVRSSDLDDMSDNPTWSAPYSTPNSTTSLGGVQAGRYVQFKADFTAYSPYLNTAKLRNVKITWPGDTKLIQLTANIAKGPDRGKFNVAIDGATTPNPLLWTIDMTVAKTYRGKEYSDSFSISAKPRNP